MSSFSERLNSHHRSAPLKFSYEQINFEILLKYLLSIRDSLFVLPSRVFAPTQFTTGLLAHFGLKNKYLRLYKVIWPKILPSCTYLNIFLAATEIASRWHATSFRSFNF